MYNLDQCITIESNIGSFNGGNYSITTTCIVCIVCEILVGV